jgi:hypothetical protein
VSFSIVVGTYDSSSSFVADLRARGLLEALLAGVFSVPVFLAIGLRAADLFAAVAVVLRAVGFLAVVSFAPDVAVALASGRGRAGGFFAAGFSRAGAVATAFARGDP